ncbi:hypothetical protein F4859DRAFT_492067 [Xylaria cf. heliscus]|nr:hypothetical protein F4859DRAFT_492067 [Xylaria cf. heliscus]
MRLSGTVLHISKVQDSRHRSFIWIAVWYGFLFGDFIIARFPRIPYIVFSSLFVIVFFCLFLSRYLPVLFRYLPIFTLPIYLYNVSDLPAYLAHGSLLTLSHLSYVVCTYHHGY